MEKSNKKEKDHFKRLLVNHLNSFEKCVEWADYSNWLIKAGAIFSENKLPFVVEKHLLAKRLA